MSTPAKPDYEAIRELIGEAVREAFYSVGKRTVTMWFVDFRQSPSHHLTGSHEWVAVEGPLATEEQGWDWIDGRGMGSRDYAKDYYRVRQVALVSGW